MGNSIYTIFMPREAFSRRVNAELVSRALKELDIPAYVNDRHDIAVDGFKVSGSAYKIINKRAYHHGTMLIDADTATLKGCLSKKGKTGIVSKGVESVPSPVTNLREYSYTIDHQQFCESVLNEFTYDYNGGLDVEVKYLVVILCMTFSLTVGSSPLFSMNHTWIVFHKGCMICERNCRHGIGCMVRHQNLPMK